METSTTKHKVQAIYPLSFMQQGLLFHHLSSAYDQGFLNVQCTLEGSIDILLFKKAWNTIVERHEVLRSTIHWKNLKKPVQIVHPHKSIKINFIDWTPDSPNQQEKKWKYLKAHYRERGTNFEEGALLYLTLVAFAENNYRLLWPNHHLLLDGWSSNTIIKEVLEYYNAISKGVEIDFETIPSHKSYLNWLNKRNGKNTKEFWANYFNGFENTHLFSAHNVNNNFENVIVERLRLSELETQSLKQLAQESKVALNTVVQGIWSILLSNYFGVKDVVHGTTVSGRSSSFPNISLLTGMYMNVQPVRNIINEKQSFNEWFQNIQERQQKALQYEHVGMNEIMAVLDPTSSPLFDSLLIFENYPGVSSKEEALKASNFQSGLTSTYPVTMVAIPGIKMEFVLSILQGAMDKKSATDILENFHKIMNYLTLEKVQTFSALRLLLTQFKKVSEKNGTTLSGSKGATYSPATNEMERQLVEIWEELFGRSIIGIEDNFFEIGGKSLMAVQMSHMIASRMSLKFPVTTLISNPTIRSIAQKFSPSELKTKKEWKYLVPFRTKGNKTPVFCFHAGEGHILFYKHLPLYIDNDRPLYAIQPKGINGDDHMHASIEEMCSDYISEIENIEENSTYNFVFYCYSALAIEIVNQLRKKGKKVNLIVVDSLIGPEARFDRQQISERLDVYLKKITTTPFSTIGNSIKSRIRRYFPSYYNRFAKDIVSNELIRIKKQLDKNHKEYHWKKFNTKCTLVLTKSEHPKLRQKKIQAWNEWCDSEVKVVLNSGNHFNQFEEPHVKTVGQYIEDAITSE
ncbi:condensation domain-containing protein [Kriegella aquimaris]|uniref:Phosphopantetheine attachment site n=1 Tax=Kriegella aquimaris TaxID=192904 RepID=A0A1G9IRF9_9FLAO|nr:condensation domain-containing protein [Kriegella aquimaris]SDL27711.1 Phosphopantetheine attachment site [Kriegella aquimaris]